MKVSDFECYKAYLALKQHFTKDNYDFIKYQGKVRASKATFYKRRDRLFFEKLSRNKKDHEIIDFFVSNFISCDDPQTLWIGDIIKNGNEKYLDWKKRIESLSYNFKQDLTDISSRVNIIEYIKVDGSKHPHILKDYLSGKIYLETLIILDKFLKFSTKYNENLNDPVWKSTSKIIHKYSPFLNISTEKYESIIRGVLL